MPRPIAISLSPNAEGEDVSLAWHVLLHPSHWYHEAALAQTTSMLGRHVGNRFVTLASSGRSALYMLLKGLGIKSSDEVIIQAFTCLAVPEPILWVGARPVYADMAPRSFTIDVHEVAKKITPRTKAIIIQHTFGIPGPIQELRELTKGRGIYLIEDCAHALGGTLNGEQLGTLSDAAILSFGRDKMLSSVYGGAVVTADGELSRKIQTMQAQLDFPPSRWVIQQLLHPIIFYFALPVYFALSVGQRMIQLSQGLGLISKAVLKTERRGQRPAHIRWRYAPALAYLLQTQIAKLEEFTARRQSIAQRYFTALSGFGFSLPRVPDDSHPAWLRFPLLIKNRDEFLSLARRHHMMLGDWYDAPLVPKDFTPYIFQYEVGSCPIAEDAAAHTINLPTYPTLTDEQVDRVIEFTKRHAKPYYESR